MLVFIGNNYPWSKIVIAESARITMKGMVGTSKETGKIKSYMITSHVYDLKWKTKRRAGRISL